MKNKNLYILPLLVFVLFFISHNAYATSGACSYHGGVDCSAGAALDGNAQCNDGTESSVAYAAMDECEANTSDCSLPTPTGCTTQADYTQEQALCTDEQQSQQAECGQETEAYASEGIEQQAPCDTSTPEACTQVGLCEAQISEYQNEVQQAKQCLATEQTKQTSEEQLQQQSEQLQQQDQQQEPQNTYTEEYDSVCASLSVPNGTPVINSAGKCVPSCDQGYEDVGDASCQLIPSPTAPTIAAPAKTQNAPASQKAIPENILPNKGVSVPVATTPSLDEIIATSARASSSKALLPTKVAPVAKKSFWQVIAGLVEKLNPLHWF